MPSQLLSKGTFLLLEDEILETRFETRNVALNLVAM